jgi:hypothetical protein
MTGAADPLSVASSRVRVFMKEFYADQTDHNSKKTTRIGVLCTASINL